MRGLIVVALGALLIWFGLSSGGSDVDASEGGAATADSLNDPVSFTAGGGDPLIDVALPPADDPPPNGGWDADGAAYVEPEAMPYTDPGGAEVPYDPAAGASPVVPGVTELPAPVHQAPTEFTYDDELSFAGGSGRAAMRLSTLLLESWISGDGSDLLTYLRHGDGADLPVARRQLVAAFWEALVGHVEAANQRLAVIRGGEGVTSTHLALLSTALDPPGQRAVLSSASTGRSDPLARSMQMILLEDEARNLLKAHEYGRSAVSWSDLIQLEVNAPWAPHRAVLLTWGAELGKAQRYHRFSHRGKWPADEIKVKQDDSLTAVRQRFLRGRSNVIICTGLIREVNNVGKYVHPGDLLRIPTDQVNLLVYIDARVLLYRHGGEVLRVFEIGVGKEESVTPSGEYTIGDKIERPAETVKGLSYGDKGNQLGSRWLGLYQGGKRTGYGIHGTRDASSIGGAVSAGCVRLRNEDVNDLMEITPMGALVLIRP